MAQPGTTPDDTDAAPRGSRRSAASGATAAGAATGAKTGTARATAAVTTATSPTAVTSTNGGDQDGAKGRTAPADAEPAAVREGCDRRARSRRPPEDPRRDRPPALPPVRPHVHRAGIRPRRRGPSEPAAATGEPYVTHPIASAQITAELGIDPVAVTAALLHDVPEDTEYGLQDIEERSDPRSPASWTG